jgi:osmotically-inducible protein OsmY
MRALIPVTRVTIELLAGASVLSGCATYGDSAHCRDAACAEEARVATEVEQRIRDQRDLAAPNQIYAQTVGGTVYLSGQVTTDVQRYEAERIARHVSGERHLVDNLVVTADSGR